MITTPRTLISAVMIVASSVVSAGAVDGPSHNWDTVPLYAHFGDNEGMTDEEVAFIAERFHFITLEKLHGSAVVGTSEAGTLMDAAKLKAANPDIDVLFYWNLFLDYSTYESSAARGLGGEYFLYDKQGDLSLKPNARGGLRRYDLTSLTFQNWWTEAAGAMTDTDLIDGVFVDALPQIAGQRKAASHLWGETKAQALADAINPLFEGLRERVGSDELVIYNGIRSVSGGWDHGGLAYLQHTDGLIVEHFGIFNSDAEELIAKDLERMMAASAAGKIVILKAFPGFTWLDDIVRQRSEDELHALAKDAIGFPLAAFLITAGERSYFNYTWGYRADHGAYRWYDEFDQKLGRPLAPPVKNGPVYTRSFQHAEVTLDIREKRGVIDWKDAR